MAPCVQRGATRCNAHAKMVACDCRSAIRSAAEESLLHALMTPHATRWALLPSLIPAQGYVQSWNALRIGNPSWSLPHGHVRVQCSGVRPATAIIECMQCAEFDLKTPHRVSCVNVRPLCNRRMHHAMQLHQIDGRTHRHDSIDQERGDRRRATKSHPNSN